MHVYMCKVMKTDLNAEVYFTNVLYLKKQSRNKR